MLSLSIAHIFMRDYVQKKHGVASLSTKYKSNVLKIYASEFIFDAFQHICDQFAILKVCQHYT